MKSRNVLFLLVCRNSCCPAVVCLSAPNGTARDDATWTPGTQVLLICRKKHCIILLCASVHEKWFHEFCRMDFSQQVHTKLSRNRWLEECSNPCTQVNFATHLYVVKIDHCYRYYYHHDGNSGNLILNKNNDNLKGAGQPHEQSKTSLCTIIFFINTCMATLTTPPPSFSLHT